MPEIIKPSQLTRIGYEYQDLCGLELLVEWLDNPHLYEWVKFDSIDLDGKKVKGLDDVTALRSDGMYVLRQVKFTVDSQREDLALSFDWLTEKSGQKKTGKSLLEKWATAFFSLPLESIGEAKLQTNRQPDESFGEHLTDGLVQFDALKRELQALIVEQIGSLERAQTFFQNFKFEHSLPSVNSFEANLQDRVCRNHSNEFGWLKLVRGVLKWSGFVNSPDTGGKIQFHHLKELLEHRLARPMPQEFSVPEGYCPPTADFHKEITKLCVSSDEPNLTVIWGTPGRGKSTYLSHLKNELQGQGIQVVRHHFFLSLADETVGRWLFHKVASTFLHQIGREFPAVALPSSEGNLDGKLRQALKEAALLAEGSGKPLVVILDGLDHVWRESGEIVALTTLFDELFPLPDNVKLIIGTQKISDDQLPKKLLVEKPKDDWIEIPTLDSYAVFSWLKCQLSIAGHSDASSDKQCGALAEALMSRSSGHPLYLTYALAQLLADSGEFDEDDVNALPDCPDGDINKYYAKLWNDLPQEAKDILHLVSVSGFIWPDEICLAKCLTNEAVYLGAFLKVEHFFERRPIGLKPFHGSILVYTSNDTQHQTRLRYLLPLLLEWLRNQAPAHIKWGWEWITEAKLGTANSLTHGPSRSWLSQSIANGFSPDQAENILLEAEYRAYKGGEYARAVELRTIKTRFVNAEYQGAEYEQLLTLALAIRADDGGLKQFLDDLSILTETELLSAARVGCRIDPDLPRACLDEMNRRIELRHRYGVGVDSRDDISPNLVAKLAALSETTDISGRFPFAAQHSDQASIIESYCEEAIRFGSGKKCNRLLESLSDEENLEKTNRQSRRVIAEYALRAKLIDGVYIINAGDYEAYLDSALIACRFSLMGKALNKPPKLNAVAIEEYAHSISHGHFYNHFFCSLWTALNQQGDHEFIPRQIESEKYSECLQVIFVALDECARQAAFALQQGEILDPVYLYTAVNEILSRTGAPTRSESEVHISFTNALPLMAFDLALISKWEPSSQPLSRSKLVALSDNSWWHWERWADFIINLGLQCVEKGGARHIVECAKEAALEEIYTISDLADGFCKTALWAYHTGLHTECRELVEQSFQYFTGYGNRKDITMHDVLEVLEACHEKDIDVLPWLKRIEHIVLNILVFTDGKETRHCPRMYFDLVGKVNPIRLFTIYEHEQEEYNWHNCDHILKVIATECDLSDDSVIALLETAAQSEVRFEVKRRADAGELAAQNLYVQLIELWGEPVAETEAYSTPHHYVDPPIEISAYKPDDLDGLMKAISDLDKAELPEHHYFGEELAIKRWCQYWAEKGQLRGVLNTIEERLSNSSKRSYDVERVLDEITDLVRQHFGRAEAFKWLCLSHRLNHGWSRYFSSGAVERVVKAAADYPGKWQEFLEVTSEPKDEYWGGKYGLQIGTDLLVRFFLELGDHAKATEIVEVMVSQVEHDVHGIELQEIPWN